MIKKTPLFVLFGLVFFVQSWAQTCGTPNNISQNITDGIPNAGDYYAWFQPFVTDCNGAIDHISVWYKTSSNRTATVLILEGSNPIEASSNILTSFIHTFTEAGVAPDFEPVRTDISIPGNVNLSAGQTYAFAFIFDPDAFVSFSVANDSFDDGDMYWVESRGSATWIEAQTVSTPSQPVDLRFQVAFKNPSPYVMCRENRSFALGADGTVNITFGQMTAGSGASDGESLVIQTVSPNFFDCDDIGPQNISLTVQDTSGQNAFCSTTITITDGEDPVLTCPDDITFNTDPGVPAIVTYDTPTYSDCSPVGDFDGFTYIGMRDDKFFYVSNNYERADLAFDQAEDLGGHVATIIDEEHNNFIRNAVNDIHGDESILIGYNDAATEGAFVWHDGNTSISYDNWAPSQPNQSGNRDHALITGTGIWVSSNFTVRRPYILQLTEAPTTLTPISGLPSGSVFPVGTTTNTFEVVDAYGNVGTCSFDVTVVQNPFETLVELDGGKLTITDVENDSDDQITLSSDGTTLTISNLVLATASGDGVVLTDFATVTVPIANITNGIEFIAGNGDNSINFSTDLTLTGSNNDIMLSGLGLGTDILDGFAFQNSGHLNIGGDFIITSSPDAKILIGELTAVNLNISDAFSVEVPSSPLPITISGQTDMEISSALQLTGNAIHTFLGTANLEAASIDFNAIGPLNLGTVTTTSDFAILVNVVSAALGDLTLTGDIVTAGDSDLLLRGDTINQSAGTITTDILFLRGNLSGETVATLFGDNDVNTIEVPTGSALETIIFNDIDDLEIGRFTVEAATLFGTTINLTEATEITKNGTGNLSILSSGALNITNTDVGSPASITHNGGNIEFEGTNILVEKLSYQGLTGTTTRFLSPTTFNNVDLSLEFGTLKIQAPVNITSSDIQIIDALLIDDADGILSGAGRFIGGSTTVEQGGTIAPGNGTTPSTLIVRSVEFNDGTFAPYIDSDSAFDQLNVVGTVTLTNADFVPTGDFSMDSGIEEIVLINNNGTDAVVGTFNGFPEGSQVTLPGSSDIITISYTGGDGNDITLSKDLQAPVMTCPGDVTIDCADAAKVFAIGVGQNTPVDIPDNDDTGITSVANITGIDADLEVIEITVQTAVNHSWIGDLYMDLTAPNGETVVLFAESLNENSNLNADFPIVFTDAATTPAIDIGNTISGFDAVCEVDNICEYTAMEGVDAFAQLIAEINTNGSSFNGDWTLSLRDDIGDDTGNLVSWQLNITANDPGAVSGAVNSDPSATGFATAIDSCNLPDCTPTINYEDSVVDGCGISEVITRTWTATDASGNSSSCVQTITITDMAPPIIDSCSEDILFKLAPGESDAIITYDLPTASDICGDVTVLQTEGLDSGETFPEGITTNTFSITDACGNETICSFTVTVTVPETLVEFTGGKLTITDVNGGTSDDDLFLSNFASPLLTISNLTPPVEVLGDVTVIDETTVSVPYTDITNGIEFVAGDGINKVTMSEIFILTGETNDLKFDNLQAFTVIGFINTEGDVEITGNGNLNLNIGPWTVQNLYVDNVRTIQDQPGPGITVSGTTNLRASDEIAINDGEGFHEFNGPVTLEAGRITFSAGSDLIFNEVTIIATDALENYLVASPGTLTLDGNINITERTTNLFLASNDGIAQQSGIINECFLILRGDGSGNATLEGANTVAALAVANPFNADESAFGNLSFTNAVNMFLADIIVDEFTLTAPEFDLEPDFTSITKNGSGESNFNANMDMNPGTIPARVIFNHNAGTINFNGTVNDFDGLLDYNGTNAGITHFSGTTTVDPDITPTFGSLNSTGTFITRRGVIGILNEARFSGSSSVLKGEAFLSSGPTIVENDATITPGNVNDVSLLLFSDLTISSATYAPVIEGNDEYDALEVLGAGTITLDNANLAPIGGYTVQEGDELVIITNNGPSAVSGTFNNLPEGAEVTFGDFDGIISYIGGDGNDVVLKYNYFKDAFITTWKTDNSGSSADDQITIFTDNSLTYDFAIDWGDGTFQTDVTGNITHTYDTAGTYTIRIRGLFPRFISNGNISGDAEKLISIDEWGANLWSSFDGAFYQCENMDLAATDSPDLTNVTSLYSMFSGCDALIGNDSMNNWDVSQVQEMNFMFSGATNFDADISDWNTSQVQSMYSMFQDATNFNQDISGWNVGQVTDMAWMFKGAKRFNQPIGNWNVSNVAKMSYMFNSAEDFNQELNSWNVSQVEQMNFMFSEASNFNGNISNWNPAQVTNMYAMFDDAINFNQNISGWNVGQVTTMAYMFDGATLFNQPIGNWDVSNVQSADDMLIGTAFSSGNYDDLLISWNQLTLQDHVNFGTDAGLCLGESAKQNIITNHNWSFTDGGVDCGAAFITKWQTDNVGTSAANEITIATAASLGTTYDYSVDWGDGTITYNLTGDATHTYTNAGLYTVKIYGDFPHIYIKNEGDRLKLVEIEQWGDIAWSSMDRAFQGCQNLVISATDAPDLSNVTDMERMLQDAGTNIDMDLWADITNWDVSHVQDMSSLFRDSNFNQNIVSWNVGNVTNMFSMFLGANSFDQDVSGWDVSQVQNMRDMFRNATNFDRNLGAWDISSLQSPTMQGMLFNTALSTENYDNTLIGWATLEAGEAQIPINVNFNAGNSQYCLSETQRQDLIDTYGWSIADGGFDPSCTTDVLVSPKVYLQGASINPISGEESLMRDDLRVNGLFPLSTPYGDGVTIDASVLTTTGSDAIVDWVWVELRNQTDNSIVIDSQSALLQRDGDVVGLDGISPLAFDQPEDRYYVVINHRNHIGIITAAPQTLSTTTSLVDLTADPASVEGGANSVILLSNGFYGMYTGDFDSNAQIQNTDANAVIQLIGGAGYEDADMDINTQIQNTDVNVLINPNIGRGEQFSRPSITSEMLSTDVTVAFANAQITDDGMDNYYEADIVISGTTDFYIGSGQVYLEYNTAAFGENVATNNSIEYSQPDGTILGYSFGAFSPAYRDFVQNDNTTSRVSLSFQQNIGLAGLETAPELAITSTPKVLFHIKIRYVDSSADADICFYTDGVFQDQFFTACGGTATADCTNTPGVQITNDTYDCSEAGVATLGITNLEASEIRLYPNPVSTSFKIKGLTSTYQVKIYDVNGRLIVEDERSDEQPIDMSDYDNGVYLVEISNHRGTVIKRLIKK
ncbi:BspA family leucine-rich repeat surface protein [Winogradskyella sp.]|uniref:BspA family leucine-rich repeat surface protein n=1 Tax=Winogradskyella sp. TaxID=1883156 RepID=UPI003BAA35F4